MKQIFAQNHAKQTWKIPFGQRIDAVQLTKIGRDASEYLGNASFAAENG